MRQSFINSFFRRCVRLFFACALVLAALVEAGAQTGQGTVGRLRLESLDRLASKAADTVNIDIDGVLLELGKSMLSEENDPDEKTIKEIIDKLKGVYVRSYGFKSDGAFADADLSEVRKQLSAPGWSRMIDVKLHDEEFDDSEVYVATEGGRVEGLAVLVAEPRQLTVINIVGPLDINKLRKLEGRLGIPHIHTNHKRRASQLDEK